MAEKVKIKKFITFIYQYLYANCFALNIYIYIYIYANKTAGEEARQQLHKNTASNIEQVLAITPHKTPTIRPPASHHENYPS